MSTEQVFIQCTVGGPVRVYVKDGKITRMRPIIFDDKVDAPSWDINARGRKFTPPRKTTLQTYEVPERTRVYAENRIKYPLKRKHFDPNGERHPELRGKDEYVRISWDEALDIVAGEIKRIRKTYGPAAITGMTSSHHNWGLLHYKLGPFGRFFNMSGLYRHYLIIRIAGKAGIGELFIPGVTGGDWVIANNLNYCRML